MCDLLPTFTAHSVTKPMINLALESIFSELKAHFQLALDTDEELVVEGNMATFEGSEGGNGRLNNKIVCSLVNIEEEKVLKNGPTYSLRNGTTLQHNPIIYLNLYILFSSTKSDNYLVGLADLSRVITFFQGKNVFDHSNTQGLPEQIEKVIFDIHTLNFEYLNHLWGILGGKYFPSILYKARLVPIEAQAASLAAVITGIETKENGV
jgi:hypothetical protein